MYDKLKDCLCQFVIGAFWCKIASFERGSFIPPNAKKEACVLSKCGCLLWRNWFKVGIA